MASFHCLDQNSFPFIFHKNLVILVRFTEKQSPNLHKKEKNLRDSGSKNRVFSHEVTAAILVSQHNETAAMLVSQTNPVGVELLSYANAFFCSN